MRLRVPSLLLRLRPVNRALVWGMILTRLRAADGAAGQVRFLASAFRDWALYTFAPVRARSPRVAFVTEVYAPALGLRFHVRPGTDDVYNVLPGGEGDVEHALLDCLRPGDVFVDVGANVGYYTLQASRRVGDTGRVVALEAIPPTADQLRRNVSTNGATNVRVIEGAAHSRSGELRLRVPSQIFGMARTIAGPSDAPDLSFMVRALTLDQACAALPTVRMMKLDIEGAELAALQGATVTLARTEALVVECNQDQDRIQDLLRAHGFAVRKLCFSSYVLGERTTAADRAVRSPSSPRAV